MRHSPIDKQTKKTEIQNQVRRSSKELMQLVTTNTELRKCFLAVLFVACENIRFSPLFAAGDVSRGGTKRPQRRRARKNEKQMFSQAVLFV